MLLHMYDVSTMYGRKENFPDRKENVPEQRTNKCEWNTLYLQLIMKDS